MPSPSIWTPVTSIRGNGSRCCATVLARTGTSPELLSSHQQLAGAGALSPSSVVRGLETLATRPPQPLAPPTGTSVEPNCAGDRNESNCHQSRHTQESYLAADVACP